MLEHLNLCFQLQHFDICKNKGAMTSFHLAAKMFKVFDLLSFFNFQWRKYCLIKILVFVTLTKFLSVCNDYTLSRHIYETSKIEKHQPRTCKWNCLWNISFSWKSISTTKKVFVSSTLREVAKVTFYTQVQTMTNCGN